MVNGQLRIQSNAGSWNLDLDLGFELQLAWYQCTARAQCTPVWSLRLRDSHKLQFCLQNQLCSSRSIAVQFRDCKRHTSVSVSQRIGMAMSIAYLSPQGYHDVGIECFFRFESRGSIWLILEMQQRPERPQDRDMHCWPTGCLLLQCLPASLV